MSFLGSSIIQETVNTKNSLVHLCPQIFLELKFFLNFELDKAQEFWGFVSALFEEMLK